MSESIDIANLLRLIGKDSSESKPVYSSKIGEFVDQFKIVHDSNHRVTTTIIYYTYKEVFKGKLSKIAFFREFNKEFTSVRNGKQRYYRISGKFDMSREGIILAEYLKENG